MSTNAEKEICGIIMPISSLDGCNESHWAEVLEIISDAVSSAGFDALLVSQAEEVGTILKRIIQNLYTNPIVVCDVSGKNPNVMFELGMRLAFDRPTIIIKDDATPYSFDTSAIEHIEYPRDLRFPRVVEFKEELTKKILATHKHAKEDSDYTTFLKHFGEFKVAKIETKEVGRDEYILEELRSLKAMIRSYAAPSYRKESFSTKRGVAVPDDSLVSLSGLDKSRIARLQDYFSLDPRLRELNVLCMADGEYYAWPEAVSPHEQSEVVQDLQNEVRVLKRSTQLSERDDLTRPAKSSQAFKKGKLKGSNEA